MMGQGVWISPEQREEEGSPERPQGAWLPERWPRHSLWLSGFVIK